MFLMFMWPWIVTKFLFIKKADTLISQIYFCQETLHVSGSSSAHHQEFSTVHSAIVYVMLVWWHIPVQNVQRKTPDDGQRDCAKHVVWQKLIWEISASVGFIKKRFVTMHGHMNVKNVFENVSKCKHITKIEKINKRFWSADFWLSPTLLSKTVPCDIRFESFMLLIIKTLVFLDVTLMHQIKLFPPHQGG